MENFLNRLARNPYAPIDGASVTRVDELGNGYDDWNNLIAPKFEQPQQTWGETALGVATAPARIATSLAGSLSPYGQDGWQMPPIIDEGVNALSAVGDAYTQGMSEDEMRNRALGMAGFMMGSGGLAARPSASAVAAHPEWLRLSKSHPNKGGLYPAVQIEGQVYAGMPSHMDAIERAYGALGQKRVDRTYGRGDLGYIGKDGAWMSREDAGMRLYGEPAEMDSTALYSNASKEGGLLSNILGYFQGNKEPVTVRGYHGTRSEFDKFNGPSVYASENPAAASEWAMVANRDGEAPNVLPLDITASNPYYAKSLFPDQAELDRIAAADPDVVFYPPSTQHGTTFDKYPGRVFEARKPGTVRSATTGETLYSNASKEGAIPALLDMGQEARLGQGTSVQRHPVFGHEMPLANNNPLTFEMQLSKIASGESDLPMGGDFYQAARDIQAAEVNDLAAAFGGDTRKAKEFVRLLNDDNPSTAHKFEALQSEATDVPERVYADRFIYDDLARTFNDLEKNPTEYAEIVNRFLADIPTGGKNPASWTSKEQAAMAVMRKAVQEGSRVGVAPDTFSRTIASNYARQFRDPQDAEFMLNELSSSLRQVKKLAANADSRPALLGAGQEQDIPDWLFPYLGR